MNFWKYVIFEMKKILTIFLISLLIRTIPLLAEGEFLLDTNIIYTSTQHAKGSSVAFDGTNYFVVWGDSRQQWNEYRTKNIYGARVDTSGIILDPASIIISNAPCNQENPSITFDGTNYFVVWQDVRNGNSDIYGARISSSGTVLDTEGIAISTAPNQQRNPSISFYGTNYFVIW